MGTDLNSFFIQRRPQYLEESPDIQQNIGMPFQNICETFTLKMKWSRIESDWRNLAN